MKKIRNSICILFLGLFLLSCIKEDNININRNIETAIAVQSSVNAKTFVNSEEKLHVQIDQSNPQFLKNLSDTDVAKLKAALYKFYSTVHLKDEHYYTQLKSGAEINISEDLYKLFKNNLEDMNQNIDNLKDRNEMVKIQKITPKYLESLLN